MTYEILGIKRINGAGPLASFEEVIWTFGCLDLVIRAQEE